MRFYGVLRTQQVRVSKIIETWKGKGWGFRFKRKRTKTITETIQENIDDR